MRPGGHRVARFVQAELLGVQTAIWRRTAVTWRFASLR